MSDNRINLQRDLAVSANKQGNGNNNVEDLKYDKEDNLEQLEDDINSGKLNEKHFATPEDFEKFILFLSSLLNKKIVAPSDKKAKISHEGIVNEKLKGSELILGQETKNTKPGDLKMDNSLQPQDKKDVLVTLPNMTSYENNQVKNENAKATSQAPPNSELVKTDSLDLAKQSDTIKLVINDKQVVVHTAGGNNLSMAGEDIGAKGDPAFLDDARRFAQEQGFKEKGGQQQQDQQHKENELDDIDSVYFSKRTR
ncbi:MAG: hypothetical protein ACRC9R_02805 [Enterovibrio sp.]